MTQRPDNIPEESIPHGALDRIGERTGLPAEDPSGGVSIYDDLAVRSIWQSARLDPLELIRLRRAFWKKFLSADEVRSRWPVTAGWDWHPLALVARQDSQQDGASKLLFQTRSNDRLETVILRPKTGRTTVCISSQVGCAAACRFCATGQMARVRQLTSAEILDQIVQAGQWIVREDRLPRNLVFMGMGEPFHNTAELFPALERLLSPADFAWPASRILISTVGIPEGMRQCAQQFPKIRQAVSLHSCDPDTRRDLMPIAKRHSLTELHAAIADVNRITGQPVMIEYLLLNGVNDALLEADRLRDWVQGLDVHLNLIPYNPIATAPHLTDSPEPVRQQFAARLKQAGLKTTIRYSLGQDIAAACGQLVQQNERKKPILSRTVAAPEGDRHEHVD